MLIMSSILCFGQTAPVKTFLFTTDSLSTGIVLKDRYIPVAVWTDSLTTGTTTMGLQVGFNTSRTTQPTVWYSLTAVSDTTNYSIKIKAGKLIPLNVDVIRNVIGTYADEDVNVWVRSTLSKDQLLTKKIFVRLRYF